MEPTNVTLSEETKVVKEIEDPYSGEKKRVLEIQPKEEITRPLPITYTEEMCLQQVAKLTEELAVWTERLDLIQSYELTV